jgi:hypothetical protein
MLSRQIVVSAWVVLLLVGSCTGPLVPGLVPPQSAPIVVQPTPAPTSVLPTLAPTRVPPSDTPTTLPTDTPTPVPTKTPTVLPTHTPTAVPTDTPTSTPTDTPTLTPTKTPVPPTNTPVPPTDTPTLTFTPAPPTDTPTPTPPPYDFVIIHQRMWTNEENGGVSVNGTVIGDTYDNPRHISGEKGPGHALYDLYKNGYSLLVVEDIGAGRPVTSEASEVMSSNDWEIPIPWLIEAHYCATEEECRARRADPDRVGNNSLCWGHYSHEITFQRTW